MASESLWLAIGAWLATYALHSTLLIGGASLVTALVPKLRSHRGSTAILRERIWRAALIGGIVTASLQALGGTSILPWRASFGTIALRAAPATSATPLGESGRPLAPAAAAFDATPARFSAPPASAGPSPGASPELLATFAVPRLVHPLLLPIEQAIVAREVASRDAALSIAAPAASAVEEAPREASVPSIPPSWTRALVLLWIAGVLLGCASWTLDWIGLERCLRDRRRITSGRAHALLASLRRRSGTRIDVRLSETPGLSVPITLGILGRAEICLPPSAATALQHEELEALLAHELAHAVRRDGRWLCVYRAIAILFFFQPLNRAARIRLQDEAEYLADDWAVLQTGERVALASCLTEIAGWLVGGRRALPAPAMAARGVRLSLRVRRLLDDEHRPAAGARLRGASAAAATAIAAVALFAPGISAAGVDPESEPARPALFPATSVAAPSGVDEANGVGAMLDPVETEDCTDVPEPPSAPRAASIEPERPVADPLAATGELGATEELETLFAFDELAQELEELEAELGQLDRTARSATPGVRAQVKRLEQRLQALRALQEQLAGWIDEETERAAMRSTSPSLDESTNEDLPHGGTKERR